MRTKRSMLALSAALVFGLSLPAMAGRLNVAVFNFQMKSKTPDWVWLEKGLADQITTDCTRSRRITVLARDQMQLLANQLRWAPELARDPERMEKIRKHLKIDYLITGIYRVDGEKIEITAQVINVSSRKEAARKVVSGAVADVLRLQKRVSAELLGWFSGVPAEKIVSHLPVWTRSIPATRALYRGLHLYDQGRYAEAWRKFRQAARNDPTYLEAHYWVGRMYYFMDRYEHARRAYEKFVYMDHAHPRVGDAVKEYLHTHEKLNASREDLVELYADLGRRFPKARIYNEMEIDMAPTNRAWLQVRSAQLLSRMGRGGRAARLASEAMAEIQKELDYYGKEGIAYTVAMMAAQAHNARTGKVVLPKALLDHFRYGEDLYVLQFSRDSNEAVQRLRYPREVFSARRKDGRMEYMMTVLWYCVVAPEGYNFKKLSFYPILRGTEGSVDGHLQLNMYLGAGSVRPAEAAKKGLHIKSVPRGGICGMRFRMFPQDQWRDPKLTFHGVRAVAQFEKATVHGTIEVVCPNTKGYSAYVDGRPGRTGDGLIGPVPPGRHVVKFGFSSNHYRPCEKTVNVEAGKTARVVMKAAWSEKSPLRSWISAAGIGRNYRDDTPCLQMPRDLPTVQADEKAIRLFWSHRGDLWSATSTDGENFSRPSKLPMPISSGWIERDPLCLRDESGRFLLTFRSDREGQHQQRAYLCWSRDAGHWSRPAMVVDRAVDKYHFAQDRRGRFIWADASGKKVTILRSPDGYRWQKLAELPLDDTPHGVRILQRDDGRYELFVANVHYFTPVRWWGAGEIIVWRYLSKDGSAWSPREEIKRFGQETYLTIEAVHIAGRTLLACFHKNTVWLNLFRERKDGTWARSDDIYGIGSCFTSMAYHPKWGYMIPWTNPPSYWDLMNFSGPYFMRGKSIESLLPPEQRDK